MLVFFFFVRLQQQVLQPVLNCYLFLLFYCIEKKMKLPPHCGIMLMIVAFDRTGVLRKSFQEVS